MLESHSESFLVIESVRPVRLTTHAQVRQQQRGIRHEVLDCLLAFGRREYDHQRCEIVYFDDRALEAVQKDAGPHFAQLASDHRGVYAVIDSDGCVVTTGHRFKRILRDRSQSNLRPRGRRQRRKSTLPFSASDVLSDVK